VAGLERPPQPGQWVWYIPERIRHSSFHEVLSVETLRDEEDPPVLLVVVTCGRAWLLEELAAAVDPNHEVLRRKAQRVNARCPNCANEGVGKANYWIRRLRAVGALARRIDRR
jgi:hypothetical protein